MIHRLTNATALFRKAFGDVRGSLLWVELLKEKSHKPGEPFSVHVPGIRHRIWLRAHTSDVEVFCQIFAHRELDFYSNRDARYIIDAGANIGLTSVLLANKCPQAKIDALEVDNANIAMLRRNTAPYPNVSVVPLGLWSHACWIKILNPEASSWAFTVGEAEASDPAAIQATGVSDLLAQRAMSHVDLVKIDIEGGEVNVLGHRAHSWITKVDVLAVELHDRFRPGCSDALDQAIGVRPFKRLLSGEYHVIEFQKSTVRAADLAAA
jgi:FkbM family methyltransferase